MPEQLNSIQALGLPATHEESWFDLGNIWFTPNAFFVGGNVEYVPPNHANLQTISSGFVAGFTAGYGFRHGQLSEAAREAVDLIEEGPPPVAVFILQQEEDGEFLFADSIGITYALAPNPLEAMQQWFESAHELYGSLADERDSLGTPALAHRLGVLDDLFR
jgi:hypothetical protein